MTPNSSDSVVPRRDKMNRTALIIALTALAVVFALGFLYIGTTHRDRRIKAGNVGCTILPWSGHPGSDGQPVIP